MTTATPDIASIVRQVISEIQSSQATTPHATRDNHSHGHSLSGSNGIFASVDDAVVAAQEAF